MKPSEWSRYQAALAGTLLLACALTGDVSAQEPLKMPSLVPMPETHSGYNLHDLVRFGLEQNPVLRQADFDIQAAQGRAIQARLYPNPTFTVVGDELGDRTGPGGIWTAPQLTQEIVTGGKIKLNRAIAEKEVDQATLALLTQRYTLFTSVRQNFFDVLAFQRRLDMLDHLVSLAKQSLKSTETLFKAKQIAELDLLPFQIELDRLNADKEATQREYVAAWGRLAASIGAPQLPQTRLIGSLEAPLPDYDFEAVRALVLESHPEVRSTQVGIARSQLALRRAEVEAIPNVTVSGAYVRQNQNRSDDWMIQVGVPIPVFNRNQGNIRASQAAVGRAMQETSKVQNELASRLASAYGQYGAAKQRADRFRKSILPASERAFQLSQLAFKGGQFEYLRVVQAQRALVEATLEYNRALADAWKAASEIAGLAMEEHWPVYVAAEPKQK